MLELSCRNTFWTSVLLVVPLIISSLAEARRTDATASPSIAPLFTSHTLLQVSIEAPLTTLMTVRPDEEYLEGTFSFTGNDGVEQTFDLKLRTRGNYRRAERHCDFAPIRLNFRKNQLEGTEFDGQDKLKLVTHCESNKPYYEQLVLREFLAYRFYQVLTDKSYGVRLMQINYVDTEGAEPMTKLGFVIEEEDDVAERVGMKSLDMPDITYDDLDRRQQNLVNVFEYMIGNTEFSLVRGEPDKDCCHNAGLMSATGGPPFTPLPYDFDFAGIVNAPYAQPNPRYDIDDVRTRLYRGSCKNNELLPETIQQFLDKKEAIYAIIDELDVLKSRSRRDVTSYLNNFYKRIDTPKDVNARFVTKCDESQ